MEALEAEIRSEERQWRESVGRDCCGGRWRGSERRVNGECFHGGREFEKHFFFLSKEIILGGIQFWILLILFSFYFLVANMQIIRSLFYLFIQNVAIIY